VVEAAGVAAAAAVAAVVADPVAAEAHGLGEAPGLLGEARGPALAVARDLLSVAAVLGRAAEYRPAAGRPRLARPVGTVRRNCLPVDPVVADPASAISRAATGRTLAPAHPNCRREEHAPAAGTDLRRCHPLAPTSAADPVSAGCRPSVQGR
jgi:hypothetical protein